MAAFTEALQLARVLVDVRRDHPDAYGRLISALSTAVASPEQKTAAAGGTSSATAIQEDFRGTSTVASTPA